MSRFLYKFEKSWSLSHAPRPKSSSFVLNHDKIVRVRRCVLFRLDDQKEDKPAELSKKPFVCTMWTKAWRHREDSEMEFVNKAEMRGRIGVRVFHNHHHHNEPAELHQQWDTFVSNADGDGFSPKDSDINCGHF